MILASASPRRRELLRKAGFDVTVLPADVDETRQPDEPPVHLVERLAQLKAHATLDAQSSLRASSSSPSAFAEDILLAADTIVWTDDGEVLGKPADTESACQTLRDLSGRTHHVSTGVCIIASGSQRSFVETTDVTFFPLTDAEISAYVATGEPMDKAGSYGIQGLGRLLVRSISGDYANVVGLPVSRVVRELGQLLGRDLVPDLLQRAAL
ncbi:MAG: Maf family protein [Coriobacteriales bacterium]|nr:Maf family protein [Coriobacteriales bacterium]